MINHGKLITIDDYSKVVEDDIIERIQQKAEKVKDFHVAHINSTYYGGGVSEILNSLTLLMNSLGIATGWRIIQGSPDFFSVTKKFHNACQGGEIRLTDRKKAIFEDVIKENAQRNHIDHDFVFVHDPQPLPLISHYRKKGPWVWRAHVDLSSPHKELWNYLRNFIEHYDAVILSLEEYKQKLKTPQLFFMPAIDPFSIKNRELSEEEKIDRLEHYNIPTDLPIIVQISRFDKWKDPKGVIEAFNIVRKEVDCTLILLGNVATDDPEGEDMYKELLDKQEERIIILSKEDTAFVNTLQCKADVVVQKSIREGFGLTVTEAMWKGAAVVAGNVGGIKHQIEDGENGYLVDSVEETAERIIKLLKNKKLRKEMGKKARESVRKNYLMTRLLEQYVDMLNAFKTDYTLVDDIN